MLEEQHSASGGTVDGQLPWTWRERAVVSTPAGGIAPRDSRTAQSARALSHRPPSLSSVHHAHRHETSSTLLPQHCLPEVASHACTQPAMTCTHPWIAGGSAGLPPCERQVRRRPTQQCSKRPAGLLEWSRGPPSPSDRGLRGVRVRAAPAASMDCGAVGTRCSTALHGRRRLKADSESPRHVRV